MPYSSTKFKDTRTGEIVTSVPLSEIKYFEQMDEVQEVQIHKHAEGYQADCFLCVQRLVDKNNKEHDPEK